jgi:predicted GIY-YIG superfamily endonuclease
MFTIYVILCASDKYYIGKTLLNVHVRYAQHLDGNGSAWTKKYKPINLVEFCETDNQFSEDNTTKKYMIKYGIENVRGGAYTQIKLMDWQIQALNHEFTSMDDICYKCEKNDHYSKDCIDIDSELNTYLNKFKTLPEIITTIMHLTETTELIRNMTRIISILSIINTESIQFFEHHRTNEKNDNLDQKLLCTMHQKCPHALMH